MSLTQEQIEKLFKKLSKLGVEKEKDITPSLNSILNSMEILNEIDTTGVKPTISVTQKENILRPDILREEKIDKHSLLNCSNSKIVGDQIAISNIMK